MVSIRQDFISWRYLVKCPTNAIALHIAQLLCYCEKANLCSLLDSSRQISYWLKLTMPSPRVQPWVRGRSAGSFPEQRLVIEPTTVTAPCKTEINIVGVIQVCIWAKLGLISGFCSMKFTGTHLYTWAEWSTERVRQQEHKTMQQGRPGSFCLWDSHWSELPNCGKQLCYKETFEFSIRIIKLPRVWTWNAWSRVQDTDYSGHCIFPLQ